MPYKNFTLGLIITMVLGSTGSAAEFAFSCKDGSCGIQLKGAIEIGDSRKFIKLLTDLNDAGNTVYSLTLLSGGGDIAEALTIGRIVRKGSIYTYAPELRTYEPRIDLSGMTEGSQEFTKALHEIQSGRFSYFIAYTVDGRKLTSSKLAIEKNPSYNLGSGLVLVS